MRIALTALTPQGPKDVIVSGDDNANAGQVAEALNEAFSPREHLAPVIMHPRAAWGTLPAGPDPAQSLWIDGKPVRPEAPAAQALRDGAVVTTDSRASGATSLAEPTGVAELRIVGGPGAGIVHRLGPGAATIGSGASCQIQLRVPGVPAHACTVTVSWGLGEPMLEPAIPAGGPEVAEGSGAARGSGAAGGSAPAGPKLLLDGKVVEAARPWPFGGVLRVGTAVLTLVRPEPPDAHLSPAEGSGLAYHRPPRLRSAAPAVKIEVPSEPKKGGRNRAMLFGAAVPVVLGLVMVEVTKEWLFALFMITSPVMMISQWMGDRKKDGKSQRQHARQYREKMTKLTDRLAAVRAADEARRREDAMDPAQILLTATGPRRRLWERRADDADTLRMRIGLFDGPAAIELVREKGSAQDSELPPVPVSFSVPVSLPLAQLGVVGLAGPAAASRALARWLVAQAAVLHSPRDLVIVVLTAEPEAGQYWNWVRWLPHCAPRGNEDCIALVGTDPDSAARRVSELLAEVTARLAKTEEGGFGGGGFGGGAGGAGGAGGGAGGGRMASSDLGPKILVVLDGARQLRRIPGMPQVLATARRTGIYTVCIDESQRVLPEECAAVLSWDIPGQGAGVARRADGVHYGPGGWAVASHEAAGEGGGVLPFLIRMHGSGLEKVPPLLADQVAVPWADRVARALAPVRDVSRDDAQAMIPNSARLLDLIGMPNPSPELVLAAWQRRGRTTKVPIGVGADGRYIIDVSADGPHGLVAGTTGAGKSEFLQTLIAVLAVANRPDAMTFVLIDYKGGSAFKDCARLPHTVGMVSDLDGHLTVRALASLGAELKRREELLLHAGAKDIEDYWDARQLKDDLEPIPRLMLIIDEFAAMVAELPDFVHGLIDIARRGRSLGVHLILATQRPAGVVSADIRANTNLRIALRVTSSDESADVIDTRDAAFIAKSTPGRCYIRSGASSPVAVQSARIGGRRPGAGPATSAARIVPVPWRGLGRTLPAAPSAGTDEINMATDLSALADAVVAANARAGLPAQRRPWLEPLPELVTLADLPACRAGRADIPPIPYGLTDLPQRQAREPLTLDFAQAGHLVIAGAARTGRSTLLRTLAGSVARVASPADVHIYGIDCGAGALLPVGELPHCGAVVPRDQVDRVERLLSKLRTEIMRRQQLLAAQGFTGLMEQRAAGTGPKLPWMLLLVDWWEGYAAAFEQYDFGRLIDSLLQILREGSAVGLRAVVTTDRAGLTGQVGAVFRERMILRLTDADDSALADIATRSLPAHHPEGRVMFSEKPHPLEAQVAMLDRDPSGLAQARALRQLAAESSQRFGRPPAELRPLRVDALPARISWPETLRLQPDFVPPSPLWVLAGAGGDELSPQGLDVGEEGPGLVVAGPPRSGRSTTLLVMARSLLRVQTPILIITPRRSPLRALDGTPGVLAVLGADFTVEELRERLNPLDRYVVLVDDAEILFGLDHTDVLERIIMTGRDSDHGLILAGTTGDLGRCYTGFIPTALKSRCGVLVAVDSPSDGDLFGVRLPRNAGPGPLGRGLLVRPGTIAPVQLAIDD
jgi:S-DNA-T family DNA segregation ATPase FtsK/SpoIIIE